MIQFKFFAGLLLAKLQFPNHLTLARGCGWPALWPMLASVASCHIVTNNYSSSVHCNKRINKNLHKWHIKCTIESSHNRKKRTAKEGLRVEKNTHTRYEWNQRTDKFVIRFNLMQMVWCAKGSCSALLCSVTVLSFKSINYLHNNYNYVNAGH